MNIWASGAAALWLSVALLPPPAALAQAPPKAQKTPPAKSEPPSDPLAPLVQQISAALNKNDFAAAIAPLQSYLAQRPDDANMHFQLAYAYSNLQRVDEARAEYQKAIELNPKLAAAYVNLGLILLERDPAAAVQPFRQAAELMPDRARPRYLLAQALERSKNVTAAIAEYEAAGKIDPKDFEVRFALGRLMLQTNHAVEAEARFGEALALQPNSARAQLGLAESMMVQKKYEPAAAAFAAYLAAQPDDQTSRREEITVLIELEKYDQALAELDRLDAGRVPRLESVELRAEVFLRQKQWPGAQDVLQRAVQQFPDNADLHARLGRVFLAKREFAPAEQELRRALQLDPQWLDAMRDLVAVYYLGQDYPAALEAMDRLQQREPPQPGAWFVRATCYDKLGKKAEAIAAYQKFLKLDQGHNDTEEWQAQQRIRTLTRELQRKR